MRDFLAWGSLMDSVTRVLPGWGYVGGLPLQGQGDALQLGCWLEHKVGDGLYVKLGSAIDIDKSSGPFIWVNGE